MSTRGSKIISLFSGCGGLDLGFESQGFDPVVCVDHDPEACKTLRLNRPNWATYEGDIRAFHPRGAADGVIGGPPCQGFSTAGKSDPNDPRNFLWQEYFRVVAESKPTFIVLENVPGMLRPSTRGYFDSILEAFRKLGFTLTYGVLNASDYGVPQNRKRLVVIGGKGFSVPLPLPTVTNPLTVRQAIGDLVRARNVPNHEPNKHAPHIVKRWDALAEGEEDPGYRRARLYADKPSVTIRAGGGFGPKGNHLAGFHPPIHYSLPRQLTVRESARLQGFPDSWIFAGSKTAQGRQVGNAVPPPLAAAIAITIAAELRKQKKQKKSSAKPYSAKTRNCLIDRAFI